jgi:hypothetical protein
MTVPRTWLLVCILVLATACSRRAGVQLPDASPVDAGRPDASPADASAPDLVADVPAAPDQRVPDLFVPDAAAPPDLGPCPPGWTTMISGTTQDLNDVWGHPTAGVFAVGNVGTVLRLNGAAWTTVAVKTSAAVTSVWGSGAKDIYISSDKILHFNGAGWSPVPKVSGKRVFGSGASDVYVAGTKLKPPADSVVKLLRFDGITWSEVTKIPGCSASGILGGWASGPSDVWLSMSCSSGKVFPVFPDSASVHYDGTSWTLLQSPLMGGIWGTGPKEVYLFGYGLARFDGTSYTNLTQPLLKALNLKVAYTLDIWGTTTGGVYLLTIGGTSNNFLVHFDGKATWTVIKAWPVGSPSLAALWGDGAGRLYLVGDKGTIRRYCY